MFNLYFCFMSTGHQSWWVSYDGFPSSASAFELSSCPRSHSRFTTAPSAPHGEWKHRKITAKQTLPIA